MAPSKCCLLSLPIEILENIADYLPAQDLSALSLCNRVCHYVLFDRLFKQAFEQRCRDPDATEDNVLSRLFIRGVKYDSVNISRWLLNQKRGSHHYYFSRAFPETPFLTYLGYAILQDAPQTALQLFRHGVPVHELDGEWPKVKQLSLAIAKAAVGGSGPFQHALTIACHLALPRIVSFLLALGANPNVICDRGLAPIHVTVSMRPAWQHFSALSSINGRVGCGQLLWNEQVAMTIGKLLRHGADPNLQSQIIWRHRCGHACWQSLDCQHRGQRPLHYAAASGNAHAITLFLREGADRDLPDNEGYIPFYQAMAQGHDLVGFLLLLGRGNPGPFVSSLQQSSPLHIACRFARHDMVYKLLSWNADPNARDSLGRTPLHEALLQDIPSLRYSIVKTLNYLSKAGADIGAVTSSGQSAHHLGRTHPIDEVRQLFQSVDRHELLAMYAASSCFWRDVRGAFGRYLYHPLEDMCIMSTIGSGISSVSLAQSTDSSRSAKVPVKKAAKKSHKKEAAQKASPRPSFGDLPPLVAGGPSPKSQHKSKSALFWANLKLNKSAPTRPQGAATDEKSTRPRMSRMESVGSTMTMTAESSTSVQATDSRQRPRKKKWVRLDV